MVKQKEKNIRTNYVRKRQKSDESEKTSQSLLKGFRLGWAGVNVELEAPLFIAAIKNVLRRSVPGILTCIILVGLYMVFVYALVEYARGLCLTGYQNSEAGDWNNAENKYYEVIKLFDIPLFEQIVNLRSLFPGAKLLKPDSIKNKIAFAYTMQERFDEANHLYEQLLKSEESLEADKSIDAATRANIQIVLCETRDNQGVLMMKLGQWEQAERSLQKALKEEIRLFDPVDLRMAALMDDLCVLYKDERKLQDSKYYGEKAFKVRKKLRDGLGIADSLDHLGAVYYAEGSLADAETAFNNAKSIYDHTFGPSNAHIVCLTHELALVYKDMGKTGKSEAMLKHVINYDKQNFGVSSLETAQAIENLGCLYRDENKTLLAERMCSTAFEIRAQICEPGTLPIATSMQYLGSIYMKEHRYLQAEDMFEKTLKIRQSVLGSQSAWVADTIMSEGDLYFRRGNLKSAESCYNKALLIYKQTLPLNSREIKSVLSRLNILKKRTG
jgi:tetratricopeptide (TPR) repeat protein